jgi:hypothetical protein
VPHRALLWTLTVPLVMASVLGGHALAYAVTGVDPEPLHGYLDHAPQVLVILLVVAFLVGATGRRIEPTFSVLPFLAPAVFVVQEHLERYAHSGQMPMLLTNRTFLVGLALQVPLAVLVARLSRRLVRSLGSALRTRARPPQLSQLTLPLVACTTAPALSRCSLRDRPARGPPPSAHTAS